MFGHSNYGTGESGTDTRETEPRADETRAKDNLVITYLDGVKMQRRQVEKDRG